MECKEYEIRRRSEDITPLRTALVWAAAVSAWLVVGKVVRWNDDHEALTREVMLCLGLGATFAMLSALHERAGAAGRSSERGCPGCGDRRGAVSVACERCAYPGAVGVVTWSDDRPGVLIYAAMAMCVVAVTRGAWVSALGAATAWQVVGGSAVVLACSFAGLWALSRRFRRRWLAPHTDSLRHTWMTSDDCWGECWCTYDHAGRAVCGELWLRTPAIDDASRGVDDPVALGFATLMHRVSNRGVIAMGRWRVSTWAVPERTLAPSAYRETTLDDDGRRRTQRHDWYIALDPAEVAQRVAEQGYTRALADLEGDRACGSRIGSIWRAVTRHAEGREFLTSMVPADPACVRRIHRDARRAASECSASA